MLSFLCFSVLLLFFWLRHRHLQQQLNQRIQSEKALKNFLAEISHEIRTPLNAIVGLLEMETRRQPESLSENISVAFESARALRSLIGDVLDLSKIESGRWQPAPEPVLLPDLIEQTVALFRHQADAKGVRIETQVAVKDPCVNIDPLMITQILTNLLSNALKFTECGKVNIALRQQKQSEEALCRYSLEVSDSGSGMTAQQQQTIFEPYVQAGTRQQQQAGVGLGLSICRSLAQRLGGELKVDSSPGSGSVFTFCFGAPRAVWRCPPPSASVPKSAAPAAMRVLVVDDHAPNRLLLSKQLEYAGHQAVTAESALAAFSLWQRDTQRFDLIITDCNMPGMNGFQLAQAVRQQEKERGLPPITLFGLTATAESRMVQACLDAGMNDCLFKPLDFDTLYQHLARCVRQPADRPVLAEANAPHSSLNAANTFRSAALPTDAFSFPLLERLAAQDPDDCDTLIESIIADNRQILAALLRAASGENLSKLGHKLQGGARLLNATRLASLSLALEKHQAKADAGAGLIADIAREIDLIEQNLRDFQRQRSEKEIAEK
ncbi:ATP-binding protein [Pantoea sp.]|uniref:ATP-binding protein n=1 Tax=Pantoea sp. TaxID=69393 RepID=UPI00289CEF6F|nr:ATP-binding protein [Pantoea sp.]